MPSFMGLPASGRHYPVTGPGSVLTRQADPMTREILAQLKR
jgi:hypothetical protein